jgi:uroporphyrinogen decarboxylase
MQNQRHPVLERLIASRPRPPICLWKHFADHQRSGPEMVAAHLEFHRLVQPDLVKIMNDAPFPLQGVEAVQSACDWARLRPTPMRHQAFVQLVDDVAAIVEGLNGSAPATVTIFNPFSIANDNRGQAVPTADLACRRIMQDLRENEGATLHAFEMISQTLISLVERLAATGVDGIFFAAIGGEADRFCRSEFDRIMVPSEWAVLQSARSASLLTLLHICGDGLALDRYRTALFDIANWHAGGSNLDLAEGARLLGTDVMGGIDQNILSLPELAKAEGFLPAVIGPGCAFSLETEVSDLSRLSARLAGLSEQATRASSEHPTPILRH